MLVGELGDGVAHPLVERPLGHLSPVQVHDRHAEQDGRRHDVEQLPAVAEHDEHVDVLVAQRSAGGAGEHGTLLELRLDRHLGHRLGERHDALAPRLPRGAEALGGQGARRGRRRHT